MEIGTEVLDGTRRGVVVDNALANMATVEFSCGRVELVPCELLSEPLNTQPKREKGCIPPIGCAFRYPTAAQPALAPLQTT